MDRSLIKMSNNKVAFANQYPFDKDTVVTFGIDKHGAYSEVYIGQNYVLGSIKRSYSHIYRGETAIKVVELVPQKYKEIVRELSLALGTIK